MDALIIFLSIASITILPCTIALFEKQWIELNTSISAMLLSPLYVAQINLMNFWTGIKSFYRGQFVDNNDNLNLNKVFYQFIGSTLYSVSFSLFVFADFHHIPAT